MATLDFMYAGTPKPLGPDGEMSCIARSSVTGPWHINELGLAGDQRVYRGNQGPDNALHHYARDHYETWLDERPDLADRLAEPPAFGENISLSGFTEETVCIGDIYRVGPVVLELCHGREPCHKLNYRFGVNDMTRDVMKSGRIGWYYRVKEPGVIEPGSDFVLEDRPHPDWTVLRTFRVLYAKNVDPGEAAALAAVPALAEEWAKMARKAAAVV